MLGTFIILVDLPSSFFKAIQAIREHFRTGFTKRDGHAKETYLPLVNSTFKNDPGMLKSLIPRQRAKEKQKGQPQVINARGKIRQRAPKTQQKDSTGKFIAGSSDVDDGNDSEAQFEPGTREHAQQFVDKWRGHRDKQLSMGLEYSNLVKQHAELADAMRTQERSWQKKYNRKVDQLASLQTKYDKQKESVVGLHRDLAEARTSIRARDRQLAEDTSSRTVSLTSASILIDLPSSFFKAIQAFAKHLLDRFLLDMHTKLL